MKKSTTLKKCALVLMVFIALFALAACDDVAQTEPTPEEEAEPVYLVYKMVSKGNNSFVEIDLLDHTVTIYNTISGKRGTSHTAEYTGEYPDTITAEFPKIESTKTFTFDGNKLHEEDSRGFEHDFKLESKR